MNLNLANGWGIVRTIVDMCLKMPEGKYVLVKDPNKSVIRLYDVPIGTFEDDDEGTVASAAQKDGDTKEDEEGNEE